MLLVEDLCLRRRILEWPQHLRLEIAGTRMHALDFQAWIFKSRASVVRMQSTSGIGKQDFAELVKSLREGGRVSHYDSRQSCLSQIGRSQLCGSTRRSKALRNAVSFWRHFMGAYSVPRSSLLTSPSFRILRWSNSNSRRTQTRTVPMPPRFRWYSKTRTTCREITAIIRRMSSLLSRCPNRRCHNNSHRNSRKFPYEDRCPSRRLVCRDLCHSHKHASKGHSHS